MNHEGTVRRIAWLRALVVVAALILAVRVVQIQVIRHEDFSRISKKQWAKESAVPAVRGDIRDRAGRPLALAVTNWRVGVAASKIVDRDSLVARLGRVLGQDPGGLRRRVASAGDGHVVLARAVALTREQKSLLRRCRAVTLDTVRSRVYPADGVGASYIGFCREGTDTTIATGLEHSLQGVLGGRPGRSTSVATGIPGRDLGRIVVEEAVHGRSLTLSLDLELQTLCEQHLAAAVRDYGARGGTVLVMDPSTGDVLAAASWPLVTTRRQSQTDGAVWQNRNFTGLFEPGSIFKIFTAASLLRHAAIDTATVFDCSNGDLGTFVMHNDDNHRYGPLSLFRAIALSANIFFGRAVVNLDADEFYRDLLDFGFGQATSAPYPGQERGLLGPPATWSGRSQATIAIGQEIATTPLQVGLAMCAVANGGMLYAPRLVTGIRDRQGAEMETIEPVPLRRVMSEPLAALLREAMARVVSEGTGKAAHLDWVRVGGKTGTAQKSRDGRGYTPGAYVASFAGIVPADAPRLAVLTTLDEPRGHYHYAAQSAAPLFRAVVEDIRRSTSWLTDVPGSRTAVVAAAGVDDRRTVPDVLHISAAAAVQRLAAAGLAATGAERDGVVVAQIPAAGAVCGTGTPVRLQVAGRTEASGRSGLVCPDFSGLSNREVRGLAARLGIDVAVRGVGYAIGQEPLPGQDLAGRRVQILLEGPWR